ncbi:response regulator [Pseudoalteromonas shioyasakiensis]|uniref:response regulator n=1 Tax=Pseudoalteromonas shioyasakiensis TaxID=1190813 RepID=UPI002117693C|nr:response regulator [Pseudoalteromonas shioyasakiensis]MCQ8877680.1 response regulator [Pseudoalteromonas shioyasakiensis]
MIYLAIFLIIMFFLWRKLFFKHSGVKASSVTQENTSKYTQSLLNCLPLMLYIEDVNNALLFSNNAFKAEFNALWDLNSNQINDSLPIAVMLKEQNEEVLQSSQALCYTAVIPNGKGVLQQVEYTKQPYFDTNNTVCGVLTTFDKVTELTQVSANEIQHDIDSLLLLDRFVEGTFEFEYFSNGEGCFNRLSEGAKAILGLSEEAINQVGLTGCISPTIIDEDRVKIARSFKNNTGQQQKIQCLFRYRANDKINQCRLIAVHHQQDDNKTGSSYWLGLLLEHEQVVATDDLIEPEIKVQSDINYQSWQLCSDDDAILEQLEFNQITFQKNTINGFERLLTDTSYIIITKVDLEKKYGDFWLEKLNGVKGKVIIVGDFNEQPYYFSDSVMGLSASVFKQSGLSEIMHNFKLSTPNHIELSAPATKLLIAEDNPMNQLLVQQQLESLGFDVTLAGNGEIAYEILNHDTFSAIITDFNMPIVDGLELAEKVRSSACARIKNIPIIGITADNLSETLAKAKNVGIDHVICKPYSLDDLHELLLKLIEPVNKTKFKVVESNSDEGYSLSHWVAIFGNKHDAIAMANVFYTTLKADLAALKVAIENKDISQCEMLLHRIKGSIAMVKIDSLRKEIELSEALLSNKKQIDNNVYTLIEELSELNKAVYNWLN